MSRTSDLYKKKLLCFTNGDKDLAVIVGLDWIAKNIKPVLKLVPDSYIDLIKKKILVIENHVYENAFLNECEKSLKNDSSRTGLIIDKIVNLDPTEIDGLSKVCDIIASLRSSVEEQAILRDFKLK